MLSNISYVAHVFQSLRLRYVNERTSRYDTEILPYLTCAHISVNPQGNRGKLYPNRLRGHDSSFA